MREALLQSTPVEYASAAIRGRGAPLMRPPSQNALLTGSELIRAWRGPKLLNGVTGSRQFYLTDNNYAGLGDATNPGTGNIFTVKQLLHFVGSGQVSFAGTAIGGAVAASTLSYMRKSGATYVTPVYQAGHAQPSAPGLFAKSSPSSGKTPMSGAVAVCIWRVCSITGQVSLKSLLSVVVTLSNQTCIVQFPSADTNGQDIFGIGVPQLGFADLGIEYALPISRGGEVQESTLAYTRSTGSATIVNNTNIVNAAGANLTSADIGRRWAFGTYDSWIVSINSPTQAVMNDTNTSGADITGAGTITHAVDGYTRAVEISWANGDLIGQPLAPDKAFPPPAAQFGGVLNDTLWLEGDQIIYPGDPGYNGSFPRSNAIFPNESAIAYLPWADGVIARISRHSLGVLVYTGGAPALEFQVVLKNIGIKYGANAALGAPGRLLLWSGKPVVIDSSLNVDDQFFERVRPDFDGWDAGQTVDQPIVPGYDPQGKYEVWCYGQKVMPFHVPSGERGRWCAPVSLAGKTIGNVVATVTTPDQKLLLCCSDGAQLKLYEFDAGTGSTMVVQTDDLRSKLFADMISQVIVQGRTDNTANNVKVEIVKNYNDASPVTLLNGAPAQTGVQDFKVRPNITGAKQHAVRITMTGVGGLAQSDGSIMDCGVDGLVTYGESSDCYF